MSVNAGSSGGKQGERTRLYPAAASGDGMGSTSAAAVSNRSSDIEQQSRIPNEEDEMDEEEEDSDDKKAAVFGALDGVLTSFAIVAGAAGGGLGTQAVLIIGISSIVANGLSMGLGEYLSSKAMNDYMEMERKREEWELTHHRQEEVSSMVELYMGRGMSREDAQEVSSRLSKYDDCFVDAMMAEKISSYAPPLDEGGSIREGLVTFGSFALSGMLPLLAYAFSSLLSTSQDALFLWACVITAAALFAIGVVKASCVSRSWFGSGLETLLLGGCCAGLAYEIGMAVAACV